MASLRSARKNAIPSSTSTGKNVRSLPPPPPPPEVWWSGKTLGYSVRTVSVFLGFFGGVFLVFFLFGAPVRFPPLGMVRVFCRWHFLRASCNILPRSKKIQKTHQKSTTLTLGLSSVRVGILLAVTPVPVCGNRQRHWEQGIRQGTDFADAIICPPPWGNLKANVHYQNPSSPVRLYQACSLYGVPFDCNGFGRSSERQAWYNRGTRYLWPFRKEPPVGPTGAVVRGPCFSIF